MTGMRSFWAGLSETAAAMAGVISPKRALAVMMPMGPQDHIGALTVYHHGVLPGGGGVGAGLEHGGGGGGVGADGDDLGGGEGGGFELGHQGGAHFAPLAVDDEDLFLLHGKGPFYWYYHSR